VTKQFFVTKVLLIEFLGGKSRKFIISYFGKFIKKINILTEISEIYVLQSKLFNPFDIFAAENFFFKCKQFNKGISKLLYYR